MKKTRFSWRVIAIITCMVLCASDVIGLFGDGISAFAAGETPNQNEQYVNLYNKIDQTSITGDQGVKEKNYLEKALDNNYKTKWCVAIDLKNGECARTLQWAMTEPVTLDAYSFVTAGDAEVKDPNKWVLYGKNDVNDDWTVLSEVTDGNLPVDRYTVSDSFYIENPSEYQYYKLTVLEQKNGNTKGGHYQFSELNLFTKCHDLHDQVEQMSIGGDIGTEETTTPDKTFDQSSATKWNVGISEEDTTKSVWWAMEESVAIGSYTLVTADDEEGYDPSAWKLYGRDDTRDQWTELSSVSDGGLPSNRQTASIGYFVENPEEYKYYKLTVSANRAGANDTYYQISELNLFEAETEPTDETEEYTDLYDKIDQTSIEDVKNAFDKDSATKWSATVDVENADCVRTIQWAMTEQVTLDAYSFATADDNVKSDPWAWTLYGTNDTAGEWRELSSVTEGNLPTDRKLTSEIFSVENVGSYQYYKLSITNNRSSLGSTTYQFAELNLFTTGEGGNDNIQYASLYNQIDFTSVANDGEVTANGGVGNIFDKDTSTFWCVRKGTNEATGFERSVWWAMTEAVAVEAYTIVTGPEAINVNRDPWTWTLYGTNDEATFQGTANQWNLLDSVSESNISTDRETSSETFVVDAPDEYKYYKLIFTGNRPNDVGNSSLAFSELNLLQEGTEGGETGGETGGDTGTVTEGETVDSGISVDNAGTQGLVNIHSLINQASITGDAGVKESNGLKLALDNDYSTKWCVAIELGNGECARTLQWSMTKAVTLQGYAFATAKDVEVRDPSKWVLYGTNDLNGEWTVVSSVDEGNLPEDRETTSNIYKIVNPAEYQHYKLVVLEQKNGNTKGAHYQFAEFIMFANKNEVGDVTTDTNTGGSNSGTSTETGTTGSTTSTDSGISVDDAAKHGFVNIHSLINQSSITGDEGVKETNGLKMALDDNIGTKWCVAIELGNGECARTLQWSMTKAVSLQGYAFVTAKDVPSKDPQKWALYGTNNTSGEWTLLTSVEGANLPEDRRATSNIFTIANPGKYQHYKLVVLENRTGNTKGAHYQFSELLLFAKEAVVGSVSGTTTGSASTDSGISVDDARVHGYVNVHSFIDLTSITGDEGVKASNGLKNAFDDNYKTKYCVETIIGEDGTRTVQWSMKQKMTLSGYAFVTGGDVPERDPHTWALYGTNDTNGEWTLLSSVEGASLPEDRGTASNIFKIENQGEYQHYKLVITNNRGLRAKEGYRHYQFSELLLFADESTVPTETVEVEKDEVKQEVVFFEMEENNMSGVWWIVLAVVIVAGGIVTVVLLNNRKKVKKEQIKEDVQ